MNKYEWSGAILAGGRSSRMGRDKALLRFEASTLLELALRVLGPQVDDLLVIGDPVKYAHLHVPTLPDTRPDAGPLGGIVTALTHARHQRVFIIACDMPHLNGDLFRFLKNTWRQEDHALVPQCDGHFQPLAALYTKACLGTMSEELAQYRLKVSDALDKVNARYVQVCPGEGPWPSNLFRNINTPADL